MRRTRPTTVEAVPVILRLDVTYAARRPWVPSRGQFKIWAEAALAAAPRGGLRASRAATRHTDALSVRVVGETRSRSLNARYRRKDKSTNVLSFAGAGPAPDGCNYLGELVICAPLVAREARRQGKTVPSHWGHLTVHGVLHLLGFDHELPAAARRMESREVQILDRLGFSDPYA